MNKKILASLLALFVVLSAGATVFAANDDEEKTEITEIVNDSDETDDKDLSVENSDADDEKGVGDENEDVDMLIAPAPTGEESDVESETAETEDSKTLILTLGENRIVSDGGSGNEIDVAPCIIDEKVMLPFRAVFEALGAVISWDAETRTVFAVKNDVVFVLQIGQNVIYLNSEKVELDAPTVIVNDRTLISADAVSKAFGSNVEYNEEEATITIK